MVVHQRGEHAIEGVVSIGKTVGETTIELYGKPQVRSFVFRADQRLRVGIQAHNRNIGMKALDEYDHRAGPATDVENANAGA